MSPTGGTLSEATRCQCGHRWDEHDPLPVNQGGVISPQYRCSVILLPATTIPPAEPAEYCPCLDFHPAEPDR